MKHNSRKNKTKARKASMKNTKSFYGQTTFLNPNPMGANDDIIKTNSEKLNIWLHNYRTKQKVGFTQSLFDIAQTNFNDKEDILDALEVSKIWGKNETPEGTAMFPVARKKNANPRWNTGSLGSVWMDIKAESGNDYRLMFNPNNSVVHVEPFN